MAAIDALRMIIKAEGLRDQHLCSGGTGLVGAEDAGTSAPVEPSDSPPSSAYVRVAALLHESRRQAPDQVGSFLAGRVAEFGIGDLSVSFTTAAQLIERVAGGERSVVVDGAARLGVMCVTMPTVDDDVRALADSLAGVIAALLVTRDSAQTPYTTLRRTEGPAAAAELDSGRVSVCGLIQPAYEVGGELTRRTAASAAARVPWGCAGSRSGG